MLLNAPTANPQFLYRDEEKAATAVRLFFTSKGYIVKNFLPIYLFKHLEISNRRNSVDNPNWSSVNSSQHPPQVTCNEQDTSLETFSCHTPKASIGVVDIQKKSTVHEKEKKGGAAGGAKKQVPGWQKAMVLDFCQYFTTTLYPLHTYQGDTRRNILNKIYFDVYFKFSNADFTRDDWGKYQKELLERVDMIRRWLDRP
ncbi:MAG TPA: hypothetical protein VEC12_03465 [Bacteroidia bacterium]|nr:hypothetical protein [Bacteroidia bacterium]